MIQRFFLGSLLLITTLSACTSTAPTETAVPSATETLLLSPTPSRTPWSTTDKTATVAAQETEEMGFIEAQVLPALELIGYSSEEGKLAYQMDSSIQIVATKHNWRYWEPLRPWANPTFQNFILSVEIGWNSETGIAGCDILFRAEKDFGGGEQALFRTTRLSGFPHWQLRLRNFNKYQGTINEGTSRAIDLDAGSVNHYILVVDGISVSVYANGTRLGTGTLKQSMTEGVIGFEGWQESGETTCTFSNAWVWELP